MTSKAGIRQPSLEGTSCWEITASRIMESWTDTLSLLGWRENINYTVDSIGGANRMEG